MGELSAHRKLYGTVRDGLLEPSPWPDGRISPLQLADGSKVSVTPVREVLFRLVGERLVALRPDGGFAEVELDASALADLHAWNGHHLLAALHTLSENRVALLLDRLSRAAPRRHVDAVDRLERLFVAIANATGNSEFVFQVQSANDRLRRARLIEERIFDDTGRELASMVRRVVFDAKANVRRRIHAYHRRRIEHAGQIAAILACSRD